MVVVVAKGANVRSDGRGYKGQLLRVSASDREAVRLSGRGFQGLTGGFGWLKREGQRAQMPRAMTPIWSEGFGGRPTRIISGFSLGV